MFQAVFCIIFFTWFVPLCLLPLQLFCTLFKIHYNACSCAFIFFFKCFGTRTHFIRKEPLIKKGFILPNHRSFIDFAHDPLTTKASILGRVEAFLAVFPATLCGLLNNMFVMFWRGKTSRQSIFHKMLKNTEKNSSQRIVFFPEGTRCNHLTIKDPEHAKSTLKAGLLKSVYEHQKLPVQIMITSNKEKVFNEKKGTFHFNVQLNSVIDAPIHPSNYASFDDFFDYVSERWCHCWHEVYECKEE